MRASMSPHVRGSALRVAGIYLILGLGWIAFSDMAVLAIVDDPELLTRVQTAKGWFFVLASAIVVYLLTRRALLHLTARERSDQRMGSILDTVPSRVAWKDHEGRYLGCNARFAAAAGIGSPHEIEGRTDAELAHPLKLEEVDAATQRVLDGGDPVLDREAVTTSEDDRLTWVRYSVVPMSHQEVERDGVLLCYEDITREVEARQQLRQAQKMQEIGQFTSGIAHDFNNVLSVIRANAELVSEGMLDDEDTRLAIREIGDAAESASKMVKKLLGLGRRADIERQPVDIPLLLESLSSMLSRLLTPRYPYRFTVHGTPPEAFVDPSTVEQALLNLITNARDAMAEGGPIRVEVREVTLPPDGPASGEFWNPPAVSPVTPGSYVAVSVTDKGPGIPADAIAAVFQPFFTTKKKEAGAGLGLAMVQGLMEQQEGGVQVRTSTGEGTTMRLLLPAITQAEASSTMAPDGAGDVTAIAPHPTPDDGSVPDGPEAILIVDDSPDLRRTLSRVLKRYGWSVMEAPDGEEALQALEVHQTEIALVLSDLTMPKMGGIELFRAIRRRGLTTPFAVTSGVADLQELADSEDEAEIPFIPKPWTARDLIERVRELT